MPVMKDELWSKRVAVGSPGRAGGISGSPGASLGYPFLPPLYLTPGTGSPPTSGPAGPCTALDKESSPIGTAKPLSLLEHARSGALRGIAWSYLLSH